MFATPIRLCLALSILLSSTAMAGLGPAGGGPTEVDPVMAWVTPTSSGALDELSTRVPIDQVDRSTGDALVVASTEDLAWIRSIGLEYRVDEKRTAALHRAAASAGTPGEGFPGFPCYRSSPEIVASLTTLASSYPDLVEVTDIGDSWQKQQDPLTGYDILAVKVSSDVVADPKPALVLTSGIHGRELTAPEIILRFLENTVEAYGSDPEITWMLDHFELHAIPLINPDGHEKAELGLSWRKNVNDTQGAGICDPDDIGVDVNRNFPFQYDCCGGASDDPCAATFRGAAAESEPETVAVATYIRSVLPDLRPDDLTTPTPDDAAGMFLDFQTSGDLFITPWGFNNDPPPNFDGLAGMADKLAFFNGFLRTFGSLGTVDGAIKDFVYGELGAPGLTVEVGDTFFQSCPTFEAKVLPDGLSFLPYALKASRRPFQRYLGPDAVDVQPAQQVVAPGELLEITATLDDGRYPFLSTQPVSTLASAELTVDEPPFAAGAVPVAGSATDGAFDETVEDVSFQVDTTGLTQGRHVALVRGTDADGNVGPPTAAFFWVLDPATAPHLAGEVRDRTTLSPVAATVTAGLLSTTADGTSGSYDLVVEPGTYQLEVEAAGFAPKIIPGVAAVGGSTTTTDVLLDAYQTVFADDAEGPDPGWTAEGTWAVTDTDSNSPTHSWTDSPGGDYPNGADTSLISPVLDLADLYGTRLEFWHRYELEDGWDSGTVEISTDAGSTWTGVAWYTGYSQPGWHRVVLDLPQLDGEAQARFRFRLESDVDGVADGWYVDDILLLAAPDTESGAIFDDGFESGDVSAWSSSTP